MLAAKLLYFEEESCTDNHHNNKASVIKEKNISLFIKVPVFALSNLEI